MRVSLEHDLHTVNYSRKGEDRMQGKTYALLALILVLVMTMSVALAEEDEDLMFVEEPERIELPVVQEDQEDDTPLIELFLNGYELTFKDLLPETITYAPADDTPMADLVFSVTLSKEEAQTEPEETAATQQTAEPEETAEPAEEADLNVPVFTMMMEEDIGDHVIVLSDEAGHIVPVAFYMADMPEGLDAKHTNEFIAAQLDVHVLRATLALKAVPEQEQTDQKPAEGLLAGAGGYELSYSVPESAGLNVRKENDAFEFFTTIGGEDITVFTIAIGEEDGDILQMLTDSAGERVCVAIRIASCPETLDDEQTSVFYTAQEAVAQLMSSMTLQ